MQKKIVFAVVFASLLCLPRPAEALCKRDRWILAGSAAAVIFPLALFGFRDRPQPIGVPTGKADGQIWLPFSREKIDSNELDGFGTRDPDEIIVKLREKNIVVILLNVEGLKAQNEINDRETLEYFQTLSDQAKDEDGKVLSTLYVPPSHMVMTERGKIFLLERPLFARHVFVVRGKPERRQLLQQYIHFLIAKAHATKNYKVNDTFTSYYSLLLAAEEIVNARIAAKGKSITLSDLADVDSSLYMKALVSPGEVIDASRVLLDHREEFQLTEAEKNAAAKTHRAAAQKLSEFRKNRLIAIHELVKPERLTHAEDLARYEEMIKSYRELEGWLREDTTWNARLEACLADEK